MRALIEACEDSNFPAEIVLVLSNKRDAAGLEFAREKKIPTAFIDHKNFSSREAFDKKVSEEIAKSGAQIICLAGFMRLLSPWFVNHWFDRLINIHPSLLPDFKGANAVSDAIKAGAKISGCSVHFVREAMDSGPIILQAQVPVFPGDTKEILAARILKEEHRIYPDALKKICDNFRLMKTLTLIIAPDPLLKRVSKSVIKVDGELHQLMRDMVATMYNERGIGLAAVQVGVLKRVLVIDVDYKIEDHEHHHHSECNGIHLTDTNPRYFVNPEIIEFSKECSAFNEGCLSFPGARSEVVRPAKVKVKYLDFYGKEQIEEMEGLLATCIQHEIDHLNGITFVDHISKVKRDMILKKMKKSQK